ncbi:hypothetical protein [Legionella drozanskii]|uniref:Uncharacterized protein n=1 Tax=Legionella drozanskii LLAP-1 TaxID=1212489 RepID=A0A0W0SQK6_9GAMM|nr:hypothetical protein [Legionella drozanskii]KTC85698.1 hypothetical protein Ldro_2023 [Legionella drozanskii LLAP-1]
MSMTLTQWWKQLNDDLNQLKPTLSKGDSSWDGSYWTAAEQMAIDGQTIEANIVSGESIKAKIYNQSKNFGSESSAGFKSTYDPDTQYLPQVTNPEELLFALTYYRHLSRYPEIDKVDPVVNSFISGIALSKIKEQRNLVEDNANELKRRILEFCNKPENVQAVKQEFPTVADDVLKQVEKLAEPVDEKLIRQIEIEANAALEKFRKNKDTNGNQGNQALVDLLEELNNSFLEKETILRKIALYKKYIEKLAENKISPSDLQDSKKFESIHKQLVEELALESLEADEQINSQVEILGANQEEEEELDEVEEDFDNEEGFFDPTLKFEELAFESLDADEQVEILDANQEEEELLVEVEEEDPDNEEQFFDTTSELDLSSEERLEKLKARYPREFTTDSLNISDTDRYQITQYGITGFRATMTSLGWLTSGITSSVTAVANGVASYTPQWVSNIVSYPASAVNYLASKLPSIPKFQLPVSNDEDKKAKYIAKAEINIESLAKSLNYKENTDISAKDFSKMSSKQINELADRIALIGHMVSIQKCLVEYRQRQMKGIVKVTQVSIFSSIIEWLSTTSMRSYIHDRLLLSLEAKKLEDNLSQLVERVENSDSEEKGAVAKDLESTLSTTHKAVETIQGKGTIYGRFFKDVRVEIETATKELTQVVESGKKVHLTDSSAESEESVNPTSRHG